MSILAKAEKPKPSTKIVTLCGTPGSGKDTTAASWPQPSFIIRTTGENTPDDVPEEFRPVSLGVTDSYKKLIQQLTALINDEHDFKTVIFSTVTGLETMFVNEVVANDAKANNIQQAAGGYGAGRDTVAGMHNRVGKAAEALKSKGIHVVFLAHSDIITVTPPDSDNYTSWSLRMNAKSITPYVDNVDVVGFIKQEMALIGDDKKKRAITSGDRILVCTMTPSAVAKNRLGITEDIPIIKGVNPLGPWLGLAPIPTPAPENEPETTNAEEEDEGMT